MRVPAILLSSLLISGCLAPQTPVYPETFLWGAASSAHQTEGVTGGGENSDWYVFEHSLPSPVLNAENADIGVDHWHRYGEDFAAAKEIGLNSLRISLAWEKIEPSPGVFSAEAIDHYRAVLTTMRDLGIRPMVALHHFTHPLWFQKSGGWLSNESPRQFLEYASYVVSRLGDLCDLWITFNEPQGMITQAYLSGSTPPHVRSLDSTYLALFHVASAHRLVAQMIHEKQGASPNARGMNGELRGVGLANDFEIYDPFDADNELDRRAAATLSELCNWDFLRGLVSGDLSFEIPPEISGATNFKRALPPIDGPALDWVGVNYYTQWLIRYNANNSPPIEWKMRTTPPLNDGGWPIYPEGLERILKATHDQVALPLVVTENGTADAADTHRPQFIRDHLSSLDRALALDVRGYYYWTLTDDFEWVSGYQPYKMGLVEIRYDDHLKRVIRPSAWVYREEIQKRGTNHGH